MPYEFSFVDEPHVSVATFMGKVTQQDAEAESAQSMEALSRCTGKYYAIIDVRQKPSFAFNALKVGGITSVVRHERFGWGVIIGVSPVANFWFEMLKRTVGLKFKVFPTLEEGFEFVNGMRRIEAETSVPG